MVTKFMVTGSYEFMQSDKGFAKAHGIHIGGNYPDLQAGSSRKLAGSGDAYPARAKAKPDLYQYKAQAFLCQAQTIVCHWNQRTGTGTEVPGY